jgi:L-rhamnose mutarotase
MDVIALYTRLRPGQEQAYEQFHRVVPEDIAADLSERGVHDWRIWRHGRDLFHLVTAEDYARFASSPATNETAASWGSVVAPFLELGNDLADPQRNSLTEVWRLADQLRAVGPVGE